MPSSSSRSAREQRAAAGSCIGFARTLARLPVSIMEGFSRSVAAHRRPRRPEVEDHRQRQGGDQAHPPPLPFLLPEELFFFGTLFERQYGGRHPFFRGCSLSDALRVAGRDGKAVFVYLHDPDHPYTDPFCRGTLCSDVAAEFLDANFVSWGATVSEGGAALAASLRPGSFPFCAVLSGDDTDSITVLRQVEGPVTPSELVEILQSTIDEQEEVAAATSRFRQSSMAPAPAEEEESRRIAALHKLRREQDAAYLESLRKDQEKERFRKSIQEGTMNPKYTGHDGAPKEATKTTQIRAPSQSPTTEIDTKIIIRLPNGERRQQGFHHSDTVREIYRYVGSLGIPGLGNYQLVRSYPRRSYGHQQLEMTLGDAGFCPSVTLYIEQLQ